MSVSQAVLELLVTLKDEASQGASAIGGALSSLGGVAGGIALGGVAAFGAALVAGVGDARATAQLMAQTEAVITSTGNAAGVSAQHVADYASSLSDAAGASLFGDDQIQQSTNLLLTFTNIKGATLDAATAISVDMAQALGGEPKNAAIQLGKALNDPIKGVSALAEVGVTFNEQQKAQIQTMVEAGNTAGAQAVILAELNKEFGGSAAAAAKADGGWAQFTGRLGEAAEGIGAAVLPLLAQLGTFLVDTIAPAVESVATFLSDLIAGFSGTGGAASGVTDALAPLQPIFTQVQAAAAEVFGTLMTEGKPILDDLGKILIPALTVSGQILAGLWKDVLAPSLSFIWYIFKNFLLPAIGEIVHVLSIVLPPIIRTVASIFTDVLFPAIGGIINAFTWVSQKIKETIDWFSTLGDKLPTIQMPAWLQGHSPPPLANWLGNIADAARSASGALDTVAPAGGAPFGGGGMAAAGGGGMVVNWSGNLVVQGAADPKATALAVRDELVKLGRQNLDIFGGYA